MHHMLTRSDPRLEAPFTFHERPPTKLNPAVSKQVEDLIMRAVAYLPEDRFASAEEMRSGAGEVPRPPPRRHPADDCGHRRHGPG